MIGLDTNVLVRFLTLDDAVQSQKASLILSALSSEEPGWISGFVLLEINWVLQRVFRLAEAQVVTMIESLLGKDELVVENADAVWQAIDLYRRGKADFADCLISATARAAGCERVLTFDQRAARDAGMELVA